MNRSKIIQPLILLTKNLLFIFSLLMMLMTFKGCFLFEDEEHCKNEAIASHTWVFSNNNLTLFKKYSSFSAEPEYQFIFQFNQPSGYYNGILIPNVCPYGFLTLNCKINLHNPIDNNTYFYFDIYENKRFKNGKNLTVQMEKINFKKNSDLEIALNGDQGTNTAILTMDGSGLASRELLIGISGSFEFDLQVSDQYIYEQVKNLVKSVEFKAEYTAYN